jgi:hypothetical protein
MTQAKQFETNKNNTSLQINQLTQAQETSWDKWGQKIAKKWHF